jgi:hypothetical protein
MRLTRIALGAALATLAACGNTKPIIDKPGNGGGDADATVTEDASNDAPVDAAAPDADATSGTHDAAATETRGSNDAETHADTVADGTANDGSDSRPDAISDGEASDRLPMCAGPYAVVEGLLVDDAGKAIEASFKANVVVGGVSTCTASTCPSDIRPGGKKISVSAADARTWTLFVNLPDLPTEYIRINDAFTLDVTAAIDGGFFYRIVNQTVVLAMAGKPSLFFAKTTGNPIPPLPKLDAYGITFEQGAATCDSLGIGCIERHRMVRVSFDGASAVVAPGETAHVSSLSFASSHFNESPPTGFCDGTGDLLMGGFLPR